MKVLMVLTSHDQLGNTGKTGFWLEEFAAPYYPFIDAGADRDSSPRPKADSHPSTRSATRRKARPTGRGVSRRTQRPGLARTPRARRRATGDYDAVFYPGGHGPMWDLVEDPISIRLIEAFYNAGKPVAAVCHGRRAPPRRQIEASRS